MMALYTGRFITRAAVDLFRTMSFATTRCSARAITRGARVICRTTRFVTESSIEPSITPMDPARRPTSKSASAREVLGADAADRWTPFGTRNGAGVADAAVTLEIAARHLSMPAIVQQPR
jgi:hypothetical protein